MRLEEIVRPLIYVHAGLGGIALLAGTIAIISAKGSPLHKKSGSVFFYCMLLSALLSLVVAITPGHENSFLFSIGVFSSYLLISGKRSIRFREESRNFHTDRGIAYMVIIAGFSMIVYPIVLFKELNPVLTAFGVLGVYLGVRDIISMRYPKQIQRKWLQHHLGKMTGGYIAAVSAFFVVNGILPGILNWFVPALVGTPFIIFWLRKVSDSSKSKRHNP